MMHLALNDRHAHARLKLNIIVVLIVVQFGLLGYLLALDVSATLLFSLLCGIPFALACSFLFTRRTRLCYTRMSVMMFAFGGFGMLLGCVIDLNQLGLYGLLSICQSTPSSISGWGLGTAWQKMSLTPWTYLGMFAGGNLGMSLLDDLRLRAGHTKGFRNILYIYVICNVGMLYGMLIGEAISTAISIYITQFLAASLMVVSMLLGMTFGMVVLMAMFNWLSRHTLLPPSLNYH